MRRAWLIALREYRQVVATRGFWMLLLVVPIVIAGSVAATQVLESPTRSSAFVVVDPANIVAPVIDRRLATTGRAGDFVRAPPPVDAPLNSGPEAFGAVIQRHFGLPVGPGAKSAPLALALWVPNDLANGKRARIWASPSADPGLVRIVRAAAGRAERLAALRTAGLSPSDAERIESLQPQVTTGSNAVAPPRESLVLRSVLPLALVYLLLVAAMTTGSMMLQGLIEERSNKLLEAVLACVRPEELMLGKLLGLGAVGLTILAVWVACAAAAVQALHGPAAEMAAAALQPLREPWMAPALLAYFVSGYLIVSTVFLAIGSMSDTMQDAQAYLVPALMAIMAPVVVMMDAVIVDPEAAIVRAMTWIPPYAPFAMLARLGGGVSPVEVIGSGILMIGFIWLELFLLGRVFRASLLGVGQPSPLQAVRRLIGGRRAA
ncbi:MAG: ABC transporter permease [Caulobacteraceae bacterium]|nr:ABC transporter permease [Caulobacteraceae bacterium]